MTAAVHEPIGRARSVATGATISRRVARILALPALVVLLLLGLVAAGQIGDYRGSKATSDSVTVALGIQDLIHELQTERGITAGVLGGNPSFRAELAPSRALVDSERKSVQRLLGGGDDRSAVRSALSQLDGLASVRAATDAATAGRSATFQYYTARISDLSGADVGLDNTSDATLRRGVSGMQALQDLSEATSQERAFLNGVFSAGGFAGGEFVQFASMRADRQSALERFDRFATPSQKAAVDFVFSTGAAAVVDSFEQVALNAADGRHIVVNPQSWWSGLTTVLDDLQQLQQHVGSQIQARAHTLQEGSARQIGALVIGVLLCFAGSIYLATVASLSITRPLAALAAEADSVAVGRLPEAVRRVQEADPQLPPQPPDRVHVPARATEEIRSVATALDRLQSAAYGLATEQALQRRDTIESLANLGRRNQNLIRRQLGFITSLEREEIDPANLANLFELDHLATRMRRNAASLLVLVGASSPRQWSSSVPVADVIRAAVSEVEEYRRVSLRRVDDASVSGSAIGSVAHLLSELIENGLTFSPPDTEIEVQGRRTGDGYLIAITDQGVGMSSEDLREANRRLRGEGDFIAAPTRFLGHYVVGRLADDTGINVELLPSPVTGVTARVTLPASLLTPSVSVEVQSFAEAPALARHSGPAVEPARQPAPQLLALPPLPDGEPRLTPAHLPSSRRPGAPAPLAPVAGLSSAAPDGYPPDPDRTPASGLPLGGLRTAAMSGPIPTVGARPAEPPAAGTAGAAGVGGPGRGGDHRSEPGTGSIPVIGVGSGAGLVVGPDDFAEPQDLPSPDQFPSPDRFASSDQFTGSDQFSGSDQFASSDQFPGPEEFAGSTPGTGPVPTGTAGPRTGSVPVLGPAGDANSEPKPEFARGLDRLERLERTDRIMGGHIRRSAVADSGSPLSGLHAFNGLPSSGGSPAAGASVPAGAGGPSTGSLPPLGNYTAAAGAGSLPGPAGTSPAGAGPDGIGADRLGAAGLGAGGPGAGGAGGAGGERTQNGLRKRTPRSQRAPEPGSGRTSSSSSPAGSAGSVRSSGPGSTGSTRRVIDLDAAARGSAVLADSPADVSARLTALRAGMQRGKGTSVAGAARPAPAAVRSETETEDSE
jgi:signal transduction histidine kinase